MLKKDELTFNGNQLFTKLLECRDRFVCKKDSTLISKEYVCDKTEDCDDGSDEENCGNSFYNKFSFATKFI